MSTIPDGETARLLEVAKLAQVDAGRMIDHASLFHATMRDYYSGDPSLAFGTGETVAVSYVQMRARAVFFQTLHRLVPESTPALLTEETYEIAKGMDAAIKDWGEWVQAEAAAGTLDPRTAFDYPPLKAAFRRGADHIRAWQRVYRLHTAHATDEWIANAGFFTMTAAAGLRDLGESYAYPLSVDNPTADVDDGKLPRPYAPVLTVHGRRPSADLLRQWPESFTPRHTLKDVPVYLDDLAYPPDDTGGEGGTDYQLGEFQHIGTYNPNRQTIPEAVDDLLPVLEDRLRAALQTIVDEESIHYDIRRLTGPRRLQTPKTPAAYEWLVRFQVLGEDKRDIAEAEGLSRDRVAKAVNETAELIGLKLRREKTGRPKGSRDRKYRSNVVRVTRRASVSDS